MTVPPIGFRALHAVTRPRLLRHLATHAYQRGSFTLHSGQVPEEFLDVTHALGDPDALNDAAVVLRDRMLPGLDAVGGPALGAVPLAVALALEDINVRWFLVRHRVEGAARPGDRVLLLEDVLTTGGTLCAAVVACRAACLDVAQVLVLVDREQGGLAAVRSCLGHTVPVEAVYTLAEVRAVALGSTGP